MKVNGNWHFGWIGLDIHDTANSCTIRDYAFESTPGKTIIAGEKWTSNITTFTNNTDLIAYTHHKTLYVTINDESIDGGYIKLFNITDKELKSFKINA